MYAPPPRKSIRTAQCGVDGLFKKKKKEVRDGSLVALEEDLGFSLIWALSQMLSIIPVLASSDLRGHEACTQERHAVTRKSTQMLASGKTW